ncbi:MAG: hypothetical protein ABIG89_02695 [Candidatus Woesearchaeota archaeon]
MTYIDTLIERYVENIGRKLCTAEEFEKAGLPEFLNNFPGATPVERFFNYIVSKGYLLHGSTDDMGRRDLISGLNGVSATDNAGVALMYAVHTNKNRGQLSGIGTVERRWHEKKTSDQLVLDLRYYVEPEYIDEIQSLGFEGSIREIASHSIDERGYIYVVKNTGFKKQRILPCEFRRHLNTSYEKAFEVKREWFKGKVYGTLLNDETKQVLERILLYQDGWKVCR